MADIPLLTHLPSSSSSTPRTTLITGGASGIGAATTLLLSQSPHNNILIADLPSASSAAANLISSLPEATRSRVAYVPTDTTDWAGLTHAFKEAVRFFGRVDTVVANAGVMESRGFWDLEGGVDEAGELRAPEEAWGMVDVNLKGTMNTMRLAMHYMRTNPVGEDGARGSIVLTASTSGYFGGTGVVSYVASKHGVMGLLRSSHPAAMKCGVRLNAVVPFVTPTHITGNYWEKWKEAGLPANSVDDVAMAIVQTALDPSMAGRACLIAGGRLRELETFYTAMVPQLLGPEATDLMQKATKFFDDLGGYPLPQRRA